MIDHIILGVDDVEASRTFYEQALAPLGMDVVMAMPGGVGFGKDGKPTFWIADREPSGPVHVAFTSPDRATVDAFHAAALAAGGATTVSRGCARTTTRRTTAPSSTTRREQHRGGLPPARVASVLYRSAAPSGLQEGGRRGRLGSRQIRRRSRRCGGTRRRAASDRCSRATRPRGQVTTSSRAAAVDREREPVAVGVEHPRARADLVHGPSLRRSGAPRAGRPPRLPSCRVLSHAERDARPRARLDSFTEPLRPALGVG